MGNLSVTGTHNDSVCNCELMDILMTIFGELLHRKTSKIMDFTKKTKDQTMLTTANLLEVIKERNSEDAKKIMIQHLKIYRILFE